jgi:eukaryotic-like serine/threonine-protein kinase
VFQIGEDVPLRASGRVARVQRFIGEGGQGAVYDVSINGQSAALKWYFEHTATTAQRAAIQHLVRRPPPNSRFVWPTELVDIDDVPGFGYLMALRPSHYVTLGRLLTGRIDVRSRIRTTLCRDLAHSFLSLHTQGLCYRDISFANIFLDPDTGRSLIIDNDNVAIDDGAPSPVLGTRKFMAPEIVRGEAEPSTTTDLWSLAVLLFYVLVVGHPLIGRREQELVDLTEEQRELEVFGRAPLFVFDPADPSNRPDGPDLDHMAINWRTLPTRVRALFTKAFTSGVTEPRRGRVGESVWQRAMVRLEDSITVCRHCGGENFFDPDDTSTTCWACATPLGTPMQLVFDDDRWVVLNDQTQLWGHHVARLPDYNFDLPVAEVTQHPERPDVWGLRNLADTSWIAVPPDGTQTTVEPGMSFGLVPGTVFQFGQVTARLEAP